MTLHAMTLHAMTVDAMPLHALTLHSQFLGLCEDGLVATPITLIEYVDNSEQSMVNGN